ncbi:hypothetical protein [Corynebacterium qintianiae]|uniref:hypothetical protein n=1 Tax=Corynebacterium qintianiae TaxID=2709392 RepID=UPI001F23B776|nr:hypothetical protein [Corynebacterium qintianiae]
MTKKNWALAAVAAVASVAIAVPTAVGFPQDGAVTIHDALKPGAEIMVSSRCTGNDTRATLTTSFGADAVMTPAADTGELIGYVTAPAQIGPGPADGAHTVTVTCASGTTATAVFPDAGNGTAADAS